MPHLKSSAGGGAYERHLQEVQKIRLAERVRFATPVVDSSTPAAYQYLRPRTMTSGFRPLRNSEEEKQRKKKKGRRRRQGSYEIRENNGRVILAPPTKVVDLPHLRNERHPLRKEVNLINYENSFFFDRVQRIRDQPSKIDHRFVIDPTSGHAGRLAAKKHLLQIKEEELERENDFFENRLREISTTYPTEKAEEAFERHCEIGARIRQYEDTDKDEEEEDENKEE